MWKFVLSISVILFMLMSCERGAELSLAEKYPTPWKSEGIDWIRVGQSLAQSETGGCGIFEYRKSIQYGNDFLVRCSMDANRWMFYLVDTDSKSVDGPYELEFLEHNN